MSWTVRRATEGDAEAVKAVAAAAWRDTYAGLLRAETIEAFLAGPYAIENVRERIVNDDFFVAEGNGRIVAYADAVPEADHVFLAAIYALPERRGQGAGTALLEAITSGHPGLPIDAYVVVGNRRGEGFYERRLFEPVETVDGDLFGEAVAERRWRRPASASDRAGQRPDSRRIAIRDASSADADAIAAIYNEGIEDRVATLETVPRSATERAEWLASRGPRHPVLVAEGETGNVVGWASLNAFNPRHAYDHVVDFSVYVAREWRGHGIGGSLVTAVISRARAVGYHKMVLAALAKNERGARLYERNGFRLVGTYREQGNLDGEWVDVIIMEQLLR